MEGLSCLLRGHNWNKCDEQGGGLDALKVLSSQEFQSRALAALTWLLLLLLCFSRLSKVNPVTPASQGNPTKAATPLFTPAGKFDSR